MKLATAFLLVAPVAAFNMDMTFSVGKKAPAKKAPAKKAPVKAVAKKAPVKAAAKASPFTTSSSVVTPAKKAAAARTAAKSAPKRVTLASQAWANGGPSVALPYTKAPATLDGTMLGDYGFDPLGFSINPIGPYFKGISERNGLPDDLTWLREAELTHGRIAQLAVVGFIAPGLFGTLPGNEWTGVDAYSYTNPLEAFGKVPALALAQIFLFMAYLEVRRLKIIQEEGKNYVAGNSRIGQGGYNPFGLNYTPEEYEEKRLQELKHCRLAMVGIFGLWAQARASGVSVVDQLSAGLTIPGYAAKAGYFFPDGI